jgi:acyl dehydratase
MEAVTRPEMAQLDDAMLDAARSSISEVERDRPACYSILTPDVIKRWAFAIGDDNPLWLDADYAAETRWGSILSPPTFPETAVRGTIYRPGPAVPRRSARAGAAPSPGRSRGTGFPGLGGIQVGREYTFYQPARAMQSIRGTQRVVAIVDSGGRVAGDCIEPAASVDEALAFAAEECAAVDGRRMAIQTFDIHVYDKETGEPLLRCLQHMARFAKDIDLGTSKYRDIELPRYSDADMEDLFERYRSETRRGPDVRYASDVEVGDQLEPRTKGPHTPSDYLMYHAAFGSFFDLTDRLKYEFLSRFPGAATPDPRTNVPDFPNTMHLDMPAAQYLGYPRGFDGSMQRISWFGHLITDWMGDDGSLESLTVFHRQPLFLYDTMTLMGEVASVDGDSGRVQVVCSGRNQRGDEISVARAQVLLRVRGQAD